MPVDDVHRHRHEWRGRIEVGYALAEGVQRFGLRVETLDGRKVGPDRLVHRANAGRLLVGEKNLEDLQRLLNGVARRVLSQDR